MQQAIDRDLLDARFSARNELGTHQLKRQSDGREQQEDRVHHAGVPKLVGAELVRHGKVVNQVQAADEDGAEQHDGTAA